jgi:hypothetical protein
LLVAILFLLCFLKQTETIGSEKFSELADAHRQNSYLLLSRVGPPVQLQGCALPSIAVSFQKSFGKGCANEGQHLKAV